MKIALGQAIYFSDSFQSHEIKSGWVIGENRLKFPTHPYVVTTDGSKKDIRADFEKWNQFFQENESHLTYVSEKLSCPANLPSEKRLKKVVAAFQDSKIVRERLDYGTEIILAFSGKLKHPVAKAVWFLVGEKIRTVSCFTWNVVVVGFFWIVIGNIVNLFYGKYQVYKIHSRLSVERRSDRRIAEVNRIFEKDQKGRQQEIKELEKELESANQKANTASQNIATLLISITSLIIAILAFLRKT